MGLDWNPANKPRPGFEDEFWNLWEQLGKKIWFGRERKQKRFQEISVSAFETLDVPRVGFDPSANDWARAKYQEQSPDVSVGEWLQKLGGFYVVELVPECDGIPRYSNGGAGGYVERFSFRAQFLCDCEAIIGADLLESAYQHKRPSELAAYAEALSKKLQAFTSSNGVALERIRDPEDPDSVEFQADVVRSASRWCIFWAERGHPLEAYW